MGDELFISGFSAGYYGDEVESDDPKYVEAYGDGYAAAEMNVTNKQWFEERGL